MNRKLGQQQDGKNNNFDHSQAQCEHEQLQHSTLQAAAADFSVCLLSSKEIMAQKNEF